ncbi:hypothetical protein M565_ctg1P1083 [Vibrio cyclitrophicus FF75]|nr:hypothetical protein M565_ctg1P1083 [Vibrio cyclitrophicus FF75]
MNGAIGLDFGFLFVMLFATSLYKLDHVFYHLLLGHQV